MSSLFSQVQENLATLVEAGLVRRTDEADLAYWFKHVLTQETVYATLLRQDRRVLHRLLGDIYQELYAGQLDEYLLPLATHYAEAGDTAQAFKFLMQYGERASQMSAYPEAIQSFQRALAVLGQEVDARRAVVHTRLGDLYCRRSEYAAAKSNFETAVLEAQRTGDAVAAASALSGMARVATQEGDPTQARELGERALDAARQANAAEAMARAHRQLGISYNFEGNNALAREHLQAALDLYRELGDADGTSSALNSLGVVAREDQELERAQSYFEQALALSQQLGDKYSAGIRLGNLGVVAEQRGDFETATRYQEQAHALALEIGDREGAALTELNLGSLACTRSEWRRGLKHYQSALAEMFALNSIPFVLYTLAALAKWFVARGNLVRGAELLSLAMSHPASTADITLDFDSVVKELETRLGVEEFDAAMARGKALGLRETVRDMLAWQENG